MILPVEGLGSASPRCSTAQVRTKPVAWQWELMEQPVRAAAVDAS